MSWSLSPVQVVHAQSIVLEWKLYPSGGATSVGQSPQDAPLPLPRWISATVHIDNPQISYTAKVGAGLTAAPEAVARSGSVGKFSAVSRLDRNSSSPLSGSC